MRSRGALRVITALWFALMSAGQTITEQATIIDTGSTNRRGVKLVVNPSGTAEVQPRDAESYKTNIDAHLCDRLFQDLKTVGPLSALPPRHCAKSVSFGSSLYVEFNGERSPDLNCPAPPDNKTATLQKDVRELMQAAQTSMAPGSRLREFTIPRK